MIFFSQAGFCIYITKYTSGVYYSALYLVQIQRIKCILIVTFCDVCKSVGGGVKCRKRKHL